VGDAPLCACRADLSGFGAGLFAQAMIHSRGVEFDIIVLKTLLQQTQ
jgi:hypothetical protein